ncbi:ORF118 [Ranid herpesvirus 1]|uniref:ORF118 n=1 Tax=Ranid herpesvirus 1 TaxID=85655 RepID=Q14VL2_9VIRU|nr:ORF118 [Ranid herpesvirus 1]ABG25745.1 ORF118 [Ranid herpesvirus 1]
MYSVARKRSFSASVSPSGSPAPTYDYTVKGGVAPCALEKASDQTHGLGQNIEIYNDSALCALAFRARYAGQWRKVHGTHYLLCICTESSTHLKGTTELDTRLNVDCLSNCYLPVQTPMHVVGVLVDTTKNTRTAKEPIILWGANGYLYKHQYQTLVLYAHSMQQLLTKGPIHSHMVLHWGRGHRSLDTCAMKRHLTQMEIVVYNHYHYERGRVHYSPYVSRRTARGRTAACSEPWCSKSAFALHRAVGSGSTGWDRRCTTEAQQCGGQRTPGGITRGVPSVDSSLYAKFEYREDFTRNPGECNTTYATSQSESDCTTTQRTAVAQLCTLVPRRQGNEETHHVDICPAPQQIEEAAQHAYCVYVVENNPPGQHNSQ